MNYLWLIFALLSAFAAALVPIFGKIGLKAVDANTATSIRAIIMAIFLFLVVVFEGKLKLISTIIADKRTLGFIVLSGVAGACSWLFYFLALKYGKVSQVAPIDKFSVVLSTVIAIIFLGEKISRTNAVGVGIIAIGVIVVALS